MFDREKFKLDAGLKYQNVILGTNQIFMPNNVVDNNTVWKENRLGVEGIYRLNSGTDSILIPPQNILQEAHLETSFV